MQEFSYPSADGLHSIHAVEWEPQGTPRAVVQIVHGVGEYAERYAPLARFLTGHGYLVCGEDHLGHGRTEGTQRGYFGPANGWDLVVRDVHRLRELQGERYPGIPYIMLGHSMGSFLARTYLIRYPGTLDAAVLSGTGQENAALVALGRVLSGALCRMRGPEHVSDLVYNLSLGAYNKAFQPNRTTADWLSRDTTVVDAYLKDPLCAFRPTVAMFRDMMTGLALIGDKRNLSKMDPALPIFFLSGDHDPVGTMGKGVKKVTRMFRDVGCEDVTLKLYPGGRHEMFNETNRQEVMADLLDWLERKAIPHPSGAADT